jgi:hypothetical protein
MSEKIEPVDAPFWMTVIIGPESGPLFEFLETCRGDRAEVLKVLAIEALTARRLTALIGRSITPGESSELVGAHMSDTSAPRMSNTSSLHMSNTSMSHMSNTSPGCDNPLIDQNNPSPLLPNPEQPEKHGEISDASDVSSQPLVMKHLVESPHAVAERPISPEDEHLQPNASPVEASVPLVKPTKRFLAAAGL